MTDVIDDKPVQVDVHRIQGEDGAAGFEDEIASHTFYKRLVVRIDMEGDNSYSEVSGDAGRGVEYDIVAITTDKDVRMSDRWILEGVTYYITKIDDTKDSRVEVFIKQYRDES